MYSFLNLKSINFSFLYWRNSNKIINNDIDECMLLESLFFLLYLRFKSKVKRMTGFFFKTLKYKITYSTVRFWWTIDPSWWLMSTEYTKFELGKFWIKIKNKYQSLLKKEIVIYNTIHNNLSLLNWFLLNDWSEQWVLK